MATYRSASALAASQRNRASRVRRSVTIGCQEAVDEQKKEAMRLTSGSVSSARLAAMGHPFGRRAARGRRRGAQRGTLSRLPINRQTGELQKSLRVFRRISAAGATWQLQFTSPHAVVLTPGGTSLMVARGFWTAMRQHYQTISKRHIKRAWDNARR